MTKADWGRHAGRVFGLIVAGGLALAPLETALAADDGGGSLIDSVSSFVGLQGDKDKESIDYRARAPLVVPKERSLPAPLPKSAKRQADWPVDPDVAARRRETAERNAPAPQTGLNSSGMLSKQELLAGRNNGLPDKETRTNDCTATAGTPSCLYTAIDKIKAKVTGADDRDVVVGGTEPDRDYLTEPPVGYRRPTTTTRAAAVKGDNAPDPGDAAAYARANSRRKSSVADE